MAHGCAGVRRREAAPVLSGDAASMDATTFVRTSMDYSGFIQKGGKGDNEEKRVENKLGERTTILKTEAAGPQQK
jgi:hypothetical protein